MIAGKNKILARVHKLHDRKKKSDELQSNELYLIQARAELLEEESELLQYRLQQTAARILQSKKGELNNLEKLTKEEKAAVIDRLLSEHFPAPDSKAPSTKNENSGLSRNLLENFMFSPKEFIQKVKDILNSVTKEEYENSKAPFIQELKELKTEGLETSEDVEFIACVSFLHEKIRQYEQVIEFMDNLPEKKNETGEPKNNFKVYLSYIESLVFYRTSKLLGVDRRKKDIHLPVVHGKATSAIATMNSKGIKPDSVTGNLKITSNEVELAIEKFNSLPGTLGISTHKLLYKAISEFTAQNHVGKASGIKSYSVKFPLKEYALQCGYDIEERPTSTPEEAEQEKKRVKNTLDNFRKKVKKDIGLLLSFRLTWEENIKGKPYYFDSMNVMGRGTIKNSIVDIEFTVSMAEYLVQLPLSQYPVALFGVDERNSNAYIIGLKMAEHYNNDNNLIAGTANLLKVKSLLAYTSFPDLDTVREIGQGWTSRIKEPFESALDVLTQSGVLADWRYSYSKGAEMSDTEATNFESYEEWADTLIYFELKSPVDHTERLAKIADKKKEAKSKKPKRKKKSDE